MRNWNVIAFAMLACLTGVVALFPAAAPPANLSWSRAPFTDEGLKTYNARNFVQTGQWKYDDHDTYPGWHLRSPLFTSLVVTSFTLNGVGTVQARLVGIAFGAILPPIVALLLWRNGRRPEALLAWLLLSSSFLYVMYARLCLFDIAIATFMTLSIGGLTWSMGNRSDMTRKAWATRIALAFLAFVFAFLVKPVVLVLLPTLLIGLGMSMRHRGVPLKRLLIPVGVVIACMLIFAAYGMVRWNGAGGYIANRLSLDSARGVLNSIASLFLDIDPIGGTYKLAEFWRQTLLFSLLALGGIVGTLWNWRRAAPLDRLNMVWLVNYLIFLATINYKPNRYFLPLLPCLAIFAATFITAACHWFWQRRPSWKPLAIGAACVVLALHVSLGASSYIRWVAQRKVGSVEISRSLNQLLRDQEAVLAGTWATPLVLETPFRCFPTGEGANSTPEQFARYRPTHAAMEITPGGPHATAREFLAAHADVLDRVEPMQVYRIGRYDIALLRLVWKTEAPSAIGQIPRD